MASRHRRAPPFGADYEALAFRCSVCSVAESFFLPSCANFAIRLLAVSITPSAADRAFLPTSPVGLCAGRLALVAVVMTPPSLHHARYGFLDKLIFERQRSRE